MEKKIYKTKKVSQDIINIFAIIVIYNKNIKDSITCQRLIEFKIPNLKVFIVDNSERDYGNQKLCEENSFVYVNMNGNKGLSKAYNYVLNNIEYDYNDVFVFFDDDTNITKEYFEKLIEEVSTKKKYDIFVPCIKAQNKKIYSPSKFNIIKKGLIKSCNEKIPNNRFEAINSCTAVRAYVFDSFRYDERMFLDSIDHYFFEVQRKSNRRFKVIPVVINQNFSLLNPNTSKELLDRYRILIPDFKVYNEKTFIRRQISFFKVVKWGLQNAIKYRDLNIFIQFMRFYF